MGIPGYFDYAQMVGQDKKKKKKKKKQQRDESSSSSSSSEDDALDMQQMMWQNWQQGWQQPQWGQWPGQGAMGGGESSWQQQPPPYEDSGGRGRGGRRGSHHGSGYQQHQEFDWNDDAVHQQDEPPDRDVPVFLEPAIEEFVPVPKALLGKVIGKQAQTIIEIREKSGAFKVDARDQSSDPCMVKVAGTAEAVKKAKALIMEMVNSTKVKHTGSDYVEIPRAKIGMVIGLKGAQVNEIQNQTGTKIDVDFESDPCKCFIKGEPGNVDRAKKVLLTIAMQIEDDNSEYIDLPKATSGALIGAQGSRVREFQDLSGARIDVDKTGPRCRVRLTGQPSQIAHAKQLIMAEVESNSNKPPPPALSGPNPNLQTMVIPAHQPTSFPATLSESIARAKAAAEAVKNGLITNDAPSGGGDQSWGGGDQSWGGGDQSWGGQQSWQNAPPPPSVVAPPFGGPFGGKGGGGIYQPW